MADVTQIAVLRFTKNKENGEIIEPSTEHC